jgi:predicted RNA-binding Zn ribbon-like protein
VQSSASSTRILTRGRIFELIAGQPALDLVNTLDWRFREGHPEELLGTYSDLVHFCEQSNLLTSSHARRILRTVSEPIAARVLSATKELREATSEVFYAALEGRDPAAPPLKILDVRFKSSREHQNLLWSESHLSWEWSRSALQPELPLWLLSLSTEDLMTADEFHKVRECGNSECRWLFLDTSKNHTRRWCNMKICGNRMKARRFKAQHRV